MTAVLHPMDIWMDTVDAHTALIERLMNRPLARPLSGMHHEVIDTRSPRLRIITPGDSMEQS